MASYTDLCDCPLAVTLSKPTVLVKAYYDYRRYAVSIKTKDAPPFLQERDVLIAARVAIECQPLQPDHSEGCRA